MFPTIQNIVRITVFVSSVLVVTVKPDEDQDLSKISMCELSLAQLLLLPPDSLQVQALKRELFQYLEEKLEEDEIAKRSFVSLVRNGKLPLLPKRNLEALARAGYLHSRNSNPNGDIDDYKRSIANLAKNGQLPTFQRPDNEQKRGIQSLARNGDLHGKRDIDNMLDELYDKRNIGSLARGFNFPAGARQYMVDQYGDMYDKQNLGKRNMASLVRNNNMPSGKRYVFDEMKRNLASIARTMGARYNGKRAVPTAALLRQDSYMNGSDGRHYDEDSSMNKSDHDNERDENDTTDKRNIAALKAQLKPKFKRSVKENEGSVRSKRQADYWESSEEYPVPVYQNNNVYDYEELMHALTGEYPNTEKRFLGSLARGGGWFRSAGGRFQSPSKRHIGALARLGWLPAFRTARRFSRSGRSKPDQQQVDVDTIDDRSYSTDGTAEDNTELTQKSLMEAKRYLLLPAVDNILLRKLYSNTHFTNQDVL